MRSLEDRVKIDARSKNDETFIKKLVKKLPYNLIEDTFYLMAVRIGNGIRLCPYNEKDKISSVEVPMKRIYKNNKLREPAIYANFDSTPQPQYLNFRSDEGYLISIYRERV